MLSVTQLMAQLRQRGVKLWLDGEKLRFKAAHGALTPDLLTALKQLKPQVIDFLSVVEGKAGPPPIQLAPRDSQTLPLSFSQWRMWLLSRISSASSAFHISGAFQWHGALCPLTFTRALQRIISRHETLRTRYDERSGEPIPHIETTYAYQPTLIDLRDHPFNADHPYVRYLVEEEPRRPFDLETAPPTRVTLIRLSDTNTLLLMTLHHIIADGWSLGVIIQELTQFYNAGMQGIAYQFPPLPVQYVDYAYDQQQRYQDKHLQQEFSFWRKQLAGAPPYLELPTDYPRPAVQTFNGASLGFHFDQELILAVQEHCRRSGATPFILLLSLFQILMSRLSHQDDICLGTPIAGRTRVELEPLIGLFVNTLVLRAQPAAEQTFNTFLATNRERIMDVFKHQEMPFDRLVEELAVQRNPAYTPVFQVMFALQNAPKSDMELKGIAIEPLKQTKTTAQFDLTMELHEGEGKLAGVIHYNTDLFSRESITRFIDCYSILTASLLTAPETPIGLAPIMDDAERTRLLNEFSHTQTPIKAPRHDFLSRLAHHADSERFALVMDDTTLTYQGLTRRVTTLAQTLKEAGLRTGDRVVVSLPNGIEAVTAFLAILQAGGVYVPIDISTPKARMHDLMKDCAPTLIFANAQSPNWLPGYDIPLISADVVAAAAHKLSAQDPDLPAYMIYTSGSTGKPKGVMVTHGNLSHAVTAYGDIWQTQPGDRCLQFSSISFDASLLEIAVALTRGATLYLAQRKQLLGPAFDAFLQENAISHALVSASAMATLTGPFPHLRLLATGGEACPADLVQRFAHNRRFINAYGPTETTICVTLTECEPTHKPPPIGKAVAHVSTLITDRFANPVPPGVPGELCLGGPFVAIGYHQRPALTAERFIPDPFSPTPGARLYRSGDLTRFREDGNIDFLGRIDFQVKLRGFRIELGEIEAHLDAVKEVSQSVVTMRQDETDKQFLTAYIRPYRYHEGIAQEQTPLLRQALTDTLPDYMIPAFFVFLENFPFMPNGKIDRKALPEPDRGEIQADHTPPRDALEADMAAIWQDMLRMEKVGIHANFFEIGGHSLLATRIMSRVREHFKIDLPIHALFSAPTIAMLTDKLRGVLGNKTEKVPAILPYARDEGPIPLSFAQQRLWFLDRLAGPNATYNMPMPFRFEGRLDLSALEQALGAMIKRHEILRTRFPVGSEEPFQEIMPFTGYHLPIIDLADLPQADIDATLPQLQASLAARPFNLANETLFRVALLRLTANSHVLMLNQHHIISDGWSMGIVGAELSAFYSATVTNHSVKLPALPVQYADFALWQRERLGEEGLHHQAEYWQQQLNGIPDLLNLPTDRVRPPVQTNNGAMTHFQIEETVVAGLSQMARDADATLFMLLLGAFAALLARYSGQDDVVVGTPVANRNHREIEPLIGFFVNMLPIRCNLTNQLTARQLLNQVRHTALDAYANQDIPFEKIVDLLPLKRDQSYSPLFQVSFSLETATQQGGAAPQWPGVDLLPMGGENTVAKFDVTLNFQPVPGHGLHGGFEYNTDLFDRAGMDRLGAHLTVLLNAFSENPRLAAVDLLTEGERGEILEQWNHDWEQPVKLNFVHHAIARHAVDRPDQIALRTAGKPELSPITYAALFNRVHQLAGALQEAGVGPDIFVPILLPRSTDYLVAILAVWVAGGAFVPLDTEQPFERLQATLAACKARCLISKDEESTSRRLPDVQILNLNVLDRARHPLNDVRLHPEHLAYVLFTSGSTGTPKGVAVPHKALTTFAEDIGAEIGLTPHDRFLQFSNLIFDGAVAQWLLPLLAGATVHVKGPEIWSTQRLLTVCREERITATELPPSYAATLMEELISLQENEPFPYLTYLGMGGEAMAPTLPANVDRLTHGQCALYNLYGPTETTVTITCQRVTPEMERIPIGCRRANRTHYLLDANLNPVPRGLPGQLYVGGNTLARCYTHAPAATAAVFIPNPFQGEGSRLYATGDLVRADETGTLYFVDRVDQQVKIRSYRVELGDIESHLQQAPGVSGAVVLVHDIPGLGKTLAAYLTPTNEDASDDLVHLVKDWLPNRIPAYMIPVSFTVMASFPKGLTGKIDRRALPIPDFNGQTDHTEPRDATETSLAAIWCDVLGRDTIGIHADFFEMGGHSLLATRIMSRIREVFQVDVPIHALFAEPTIAGLAEAVRTTGTTQSIGITVSQRNGKPIPLSFPQQRLWFLDHLTGASAAYNMPMALQLDGNLDVSALEKALETLTHRHETLRTRFPLHGDEPIQEILAPAKFHLKIVDLSAMATGSQTGWVLSLFQTMAGATFDLSTEVLFRVCLLRLNDRTHVLMVNQHHIISDGWSVGVLGAELAALYTAGVTHHPSPLPPLHFQYADFALWQRERLGESGLQQQLDFWQNQHAGIPPLLNLPIDHPYPSVHSTRGKTLNFSIEPSVSTVLLKMARDNDATPFMIMLTGFAILLVKYSGQSDLVIGTPVANRNRKEVEGLIGFFVNMLPLRCTVNGNPTVSAFLRDIRNGALDAYANQDVPFEKMVELAHQPRNPATTPLFQASFSLDTAADDATPKWPGLTLSAIGEEGTSAKYALSAGFTLFADDRLQGSLNYNTDLFEESTIRRMARHFTTVLALMADDPPVQHIGLLDAAERHLVLDQWNRSWEATVPQGLVHEHIAHQVTRHPHRPALYDAAVPNQKPLTYENLWTRIHNLAAGLQDAGVGPDTPVPILLPRSSDYLTAILAVWVAGGAFVPLAMDQPTERLRATVNACDAHMVLTRPSIAAQRTLASVTLDFDALVACRRSPNPVVLHPDHLAYILFTSGSSGTPKGVMVAHKALAAYADDMRQIMNFSAEDRSLQFTNLTFDASMGQWLLPLMAGATVYVKDNALWDTHQLIAVCRDAKITATEMPASYAAAVLQELVAQDIENPFPHLTYLGVGGETMPPSLPRHFSEKAPKQAALFNLYGPTEATITTTCHRVTATTDPNRIPIGGSRPNRTLYVLDSALNPTPPGLPGQLFIAGHTLGRGYVRAPGITAGAFIPNPYHGEGARMYATGDLVRADETGRFTFIGRVDHQVKIRGYRVELGDIENHLQQAPGVTGAVVLLHELPGRGNVLTAYTTVEGQTEDYKVWMQQHVPGYMVPAAFIELDSFPKTRTGKIDRRALPIPDITQQLDKSQPRNATEHTLAAIWAEVLQCETPGIHADFFELGGHSLLATRVMARIGETLDVTLPVRILFEAPTIADLANHLEDANQGHTTPLIRPVPRNQPLPLSYQQERLWILDRVKGVGTAYNLPDTLKLNGPVSGKALNGAFRRLSQRHEILRTEIDASGEHLHQRILSVPEQPLTLIDLSGLDEPTRDTALTHLAKRETKWYFNLEHGPLARFKLFRLSPRQHFLTMTLQHTVSDGWSEEILTRETILFYMSELTGRPAPLQPLPFQYADYAVWQRRRLTGAYWEQTFGYWQNRLHRVPTLNLPLDFPRPGRLTYEGDNVFLPIGADHLAQLKALGKTHRCSLYMVLLSTYALLLSQTSQQEDIAIGTAIAGRNHEGTADLIGCFMNILVMRCNLTGNPTFVELLSRTRDVTLDAYEHQDMPFEKMIAELNLPEDTSRNPLFQAYFNLINTPPVEGGNTGPLAIEPGDLKPQITSKFDLALYGMEMGNQLILRMVFNTNLFRKETVEALMKRLDALLHKVLDHASLPLSQL